MAEGDAVEVLIGTLKKGDVLTSEQCVRLLGLRVEDPRYSLALLGLCKRIEDTLGELGRPCVVRCEAGGIHVMEDAEAAVYVQQRFQAHQAGLGRSHKRAQVIDHGQLSAEQRAEHERNVAMMAFKIQAIRRAGRQRLTLAGECDE